MRLLTNFKCLFKNIFSLTKTGSAVKTPEIKNTHEVSVTRMLNVLFLLGSIEPITSGKYPSTQDLNELKFDLVRVLANYLIDCVLDNHIVKIHLFSGDYVVFNLDVTAVNKVECNKNSLDKSQTTKQLLITLVKDYTQIKKIEINKK